MTDSPRIEVNFGTPDIAMERRDNGEIILVSREPLGSIDSQIGEWVRHWATERPDGIAFGERAPDGNWRTISFAELRTRADAVSQGLLDRGLSEDRPVMILSSNSIDHAVLSVAAQQVGVTVVPVSPAYSLMSQDHSKVRHIFDLVKPGMIYAASADVFGPAIASLKLDDDVEILVSAPPPEGTTATLFADILATKPGADVDQAFDAVGPDSVAKILFTSGSTGMPKGVINTQRMLCANQQMLVQVWPFLKTDPPVLLEWLPWNHTFGGNNDFNMILRNGGTMYIDGGKPAPGLIEQTVANIRDVSPNIFYNVPAGYNILLPYLEKDEALRDAFFKNLKVAFYAGADLPQDLWQRLEKLSIEATGKLIVLTSAWGSTETAPMATAAHFLLEKAGNIGVPVPGVSIKLVPSGSKLEIRVKGDSVTPGYVDQDDVTKAAFDEEGYYRIGDAGKLVDEDDANKGIAFDGRVSEDFKLLSGTWVAVGNLRVDVLAATSPVLQDVVVTGHDRSDICLLAWPNLPACQALAGLPDGTSGDEVIAHGKVRRHISDSLAAHNKDAGGSSRRIKRVLLMLDPATIDANEITDKGYTNQRSTLENRADRVAKLYADDVPPEVIVIGAE
ncbi:MAG: feruloyl-CoA synthase [Alphaproteobacteria bacterium]|jgi:feruloyl-CoA synthase|nr:feruloyl-CoA synthase [Alphaproteobacteria bacterium]MBT4017203.1 feruloyl-CoA synthase [Alphaproteobacteria bacterium]MBT4965302.1 feruloyl-CoA synthase [Alphaproteobacteria bacterium]MBT5160247.1 feruloyl-CoA synthase [Alphaproteobacteria bacterium]MBT5918194.1 feruloyl-CoA synthase [Alphaproteobacteria bacterium]